MNPAIWVLIALAACIVNGIVMYRCGWNDGRDDLYEEIERKFRKGVR